MLWSFSFFQAPKVLPKQIAIPMWKVCEKLGVVPGITHMACALTNYHRLDLKQPIRAIDESDNISMISFKFIPDYGNDWFFLNTIQLEKDFAPALPHIFPLSRRTMAPICPSSRKLYKLLFRAWKIWQDSIDLILIFVINLNKSMNRPGIGWAASPGHWARTRNDVTSHYGEVTSLHQINDVTLHCSVECFYIEVALQ